MGAEETIGSKKKFEQWLYDLAIVEVLHYRSDNGVFTAEEFKEACAEEDQ